MGRASRFEQKGLKKGLWSREEDQKLIFHVQQYGPSNWRTLPKLAGLLRCGKSCRLRWNNYLRPGIKRGKFTAQEVEAIIELQRKLGNRWSTIAAKLPGRTDNDIKNYWRSRLSKTQLNNTVASTNATDVGDKGEPRVNNESESEAASLTRTAATMVAVLEDGDHDKGANVGKDSLDCEVDLWEDFLSDGSLLEAKKTGFEALSMAETPDFDDIAATDTWWLDDDDSGLHKVLDLSDD